MSKEKIKLNIMGLSYSQTQSGAYALVLSEEEGKRRMPIIIGMTEAQSIAIKLEGLEPPRPLTHDLFFKCAQVFSFNITEVVIYKLEEGIFYSELIGLKDGKMVRIDSRTSDAVALALRFNCPIYTYEEILVKAGIILDMGESEKDAGLYDPIDENPQFLSSSSIEDLKNMLKEAIEKEDYERASEIRDEIKRRG